MYAQIVVHFKRGTDLTKLLDGIPKLVTLDTAFAKSSYKKTPEVKTSVAHWNSDNNFTITMMVATSQQIEGTVEISKDAIGLSTLKRRAESEFQSILDAAKNLGGTILIRQTTSRQWVRCGSI